MDRHASRGFTLIELMVAMALMLILVVMMASFVANAQRIYNSSVNQAVAMSNARTALQIIGRDLSNIHSTLSTASFVIPADENFTHQDQEAAAALVMRSLPDRGFVPESAWLDHTGIQESVWGGYSQGVQPTDPPMPPPADGGVRNDAFLQFFATTRFYNRNPSEGEPRFEHSPVLVQYYLRRRPDEGNFRMPGAYLMRRIQPFNIDIDQSSGAAVWQGWAIPSEDDICSFVRGVRIYYYDRDRDVLETHPEDARFIEATHPSDTDTTAPPPAAAEDPDLSSVENRISSMWDPNIGAVTFWIPSNWSTWLDPVMAPLMPAFDKKMFLPPSIKVRLLVTSADGMTYREVQEVFPLPAAPNRVPTNPYH